MIFERLRLIDDQIPGDGAWNMAVDEMLTQKIAEPTLRVYRWSEPTVSLGYFEKIAEARRWRSGLPMIRRWTGGGLVDHGGDWTYSLIIPVSHELARDGRAESYGRIHRVIQQIVWATCGVSLELAEAGEVTGEGCFARPVPGDLLLSGSKIAGAAQRRTHVALLHQGSIQRIPVADLTARAFAEGFAGEIGELPLSQEEGDRAWQLVSTRYRLRAWLERF